jgi:diguanylate cyclase (GGDEF)-like protein
VLEGLGTAVRLGGDAFVVVLEGDSGGEEALALSERIARALEEPFEVGHSERALSASLGIALSTHPHGYPEDLLRFADVAMYRSKQEGKGRASLYEAAP